MKQLFWYVRFRYRLRWQFQAALSRRCRFVSIYREFQPQGTVLQRVEDGTIDLGIVTLPVKSPSLCVYSIYRDRVMLMVSPKNPLAKQKSVTAKDIANHPLIFPKTGFTRQVLDKFFRPYDANLRIAMEIAQHNHDQAFCGCESGRLADQPGLCQ